MEILLYGDKRNVAEIMQPLGEKNLEILLKTPKNRYKANESEIIP